MFCPESLFSANIVHEDGSVVLALRGELDIATVPVLRRAVDDLLGPHLNAVTIDMANLTFVDVTGLRVLVHIKETAGELHAEFRLRSVSDLTRRVIGLTGFYELQDIVDALTD